MRKLLVILCALLALTVTMFGFTSCLDGETSDNTQTSESASAGDSTSIPDDSSSEPVTTYAITWMNGETVLTTDTVEENVLPEYQGETPAKADENGYAYTFTGWDPEVVVATGDAVYTAQFTSAAITYTATIVRADGTSEEVEFTVENREDKLDEIELTADTELYVYAWQTDLPDELALNNDQVFTETRKTSYTVNHYLAYDDESVKTDLTGYRLYKTEKLFGTENENTSAEALTLTGFTAEAFEQVSVLSDGSSSVDVFYARNMLVETFEQYAAPATDSDIESYPWSWDGTLFYKGTEVAYISAPTDVIHVVTASSAIAPHMQEGYVDESPYEGENSLRYTWNNGNYYIKIIYYFNDAQLAAVKKGGTVSFAIKMTGNASGGASFLINGARDWTTSDPNAFHKYDIVEDGCDIWQNHFARSWSVITVGDGSVEGMIEDECLIIESEYTGQGSGAGFCLWLDNVTVTDVANNYKVNHYIALGKDSTHDDLTGYRLVKTQLKGANAGDTTKAKAEDIFGFDAEEITQLTVAEDNSTVVNVFYKVNPLVQTFETYPTPSGEDDPWGWAGNNLSYNGTNVVGQSAAAEVPVITDGNTNPVVIGGNTVTNIAAGGDKCARFYNANGMFGAVIIYLSDEQIAALNAGGSLTFAMKIVTNASVGLTMMVNNSHGWTTVENAGNSYKYDFNEDNLDFWARPTTTQWQTVVVDDAGIEFAKTYGYICIDTNGVGNASATGREYYMWIDNVAVTPAE